MHDLTPLIDARSDPEARAVLEDAELSMGRRPTRLGLALSIIDVDVDVADVDADVDADAAADTADAADADADAADAAAAAAAAADAAAADAAAADADADADADAIKRLNTLLTKEPDMRNGLKIIQVPGRYGGWAVTRIGWMRRVHGDEWELIGARTIVRTGSPRTLDSLAATGPAKDHRLSDVATMPEDIHRLLIRRSLPADERAWLSHCPRPDGWRDED